MSTGHMESRVARLLFLWIDEVFGIVKKGNLKTETSKAGHKNWMKIVKRTSSAEKSNALSVESLTLADGGPPHEVVECYEKCNRKSTRFFRETFECPSSSVSQVFYTPQNKRGKSGWGRRQMFHCTNIHTYWHKIVGTNALSGLSPPSFSML